MKYLHSGAFFRKFSLWILSNGSTATPKCGLIPFSTRKSCPPLIPKNMYFLSFDFFLRPPTSPLTDGPEPTSTASNSCLSGVGMKYLNPNLEQYSTLTLIVGKSATQRA